MAPTLNHLQQQQQLQQWLQDMQQRMLAPGAELPVSKELCAMLCHSVRRLWEMLGLQQPAALLQQVSHGPTLAYHNAAQA